MRDVRQLEHEPQRMKDVTSLQRLVERIDGQFMLRIPLAVGGDRFVECTRGIGQVSGDFLNIVIPDWMAEKLGISEGSTVAISNADGQFNISPADDE